MVQAIPKRQLDGRYNWVKDREAQIWRALHHRVRGAPIRMVVEKISGLVERDGGLVESARQEYCWSIVNPEAWVSPVLARGSCLVGLGTTQRLVEGMVRRLRLERVFR